jgi:hypothetical protein
MFAFQRCHSTPVSVVAATDRQVRQTRRCLFWLPGHHLLGRAAAGHPVPAKHYPKDDARSDQRGSNIGIADRAGCAKSFASIAIPTPPL